MTAPLIRLRSSAVLPALLAALLVASPAQAGVVALAPLLPAKGVTAQKVADLFSLMSSELEFMEGVTEVIEIDPPPATLDVACLASTACLGALTEAKDADAFIGGSIEKVGDDFLLDVLYYDAKVNRVLRRKSYPLSSDAESVLDQVNPILVELITGTAPQAKKAADDLAGATFEPTGDDMAFDDGSKPKPATPPPAAEEEFDPNAFSFGTDSTGITFGQDEVTFTEPTPEEAAVNEDPESIDDPTVAIDEEEDAEDEEDIRTPPSRTTSPTRSTTTRARGKDEPEWNRVHIALRGGYTGYSIFNFATVGPEFSVRLGAGLFLNAGLDVHMVRRALPPDVAEETGRSVITQFVYPVNAGLVYHLRKGKVQPYIGGDFLFSHIRRECIELTNAGCSGVQDGTSVESVDYIWKNHWTMGGRGRLGVDILLAEHVGLNFDVALGGWVGKDWPNVDPRLPTKAFVPHVAGGLLFAF